MKQTLNSLAKRLQDIEYKNDLNNFQYKFFIYEPDSPKSIFQDLIKENQKLYNLPDDFFRQVIEIADSVKLDPVEIVRGMLDLEPDELETYEKFIKIMEVSEEGSTDETM